MKLTTQLRYTSVLVAAALSMSAANAASISITNAGFEDGFDGWEDKNSAAISSDEYKGKKSAKITSSGGKFQQDVEVVANTDYELSAYIEGDGKIGVTIDGERTRLTGGGDDEYKKVTVPFNSGSETTITIWGEYNDGTARFDEFTLTSEDPVETDPVETDPIESDPIETDPIETGCIDSSSLTIVEAFDDGSYDKAPKNAIDGVASSSSRWSSKGIGKTITLDLGSESSVQALEIDWYSGDKRTAYFDIDTSDDNESWSTVLSGGISSGDDVSFEEIDVADTNARYVRLTGGGNSNDAWNSIVEMRVLGCDAVSDEDPVVTDPVETDPVETDPVETDPVETDPVETDPVVTDPIIAPGTATYPSDLFNYEQWKITYPDGEEVKDLYQEENEYYYVNEEKNGIVFFAPVRSDNGTTKNSSYIRSELRERTEDGKSDIYWTTDGTHVAYVKQAITHLPMVKPHLVATQIHGNKDDGIDDAMVLRLEEEHLFLSFNGGKLHDDVTVKTNYQLGTVHEVIFEVIDGKHYVYYSEDGALNAAYTSGNADQYLVKDGSKDYVMDLDYDQSYFKVGNYTQSKADKEGDYTDHEDNYGEVEVYDFWVNHED